MEGGVKFLGHSVHPILIVFPLGLLATAIVFDVIYLAKGDLTFSVVAFWMVAAGIIGGLAAAIFGWIDWFAIPGGTRAKSVGLTHGLVNVGVMALFFGSGYFRSDAYFRPGGPAPPEMFAHIFSFAGGALALVGGWLGGELVERLGVGVHEGANVNAPSSLTTKHAAPPPASAKKA